MAQARQFDSIIGGGQGAQNLMQQNPNYFEEFVPPSEDRQGRITDYQYSMFNPDSQQAHATDRKTVLKAPNTASVQAQIAQAQSNLQAPPVQNQ